MNTVGALLGDACDKYTSQQIIWLDDIPVATTSYTMTWDSEGYLETSFTELFQVHTDHLNTRRKLQRHGNTNQLAWSWAGGDPFGFGSANGGYVQWVYPVFDLRFPGQVYDAETGLHYNYYRDGYDSATGRYTQSDPIGLRGGLNLYVYAMANPVSYLDPLGLSACTDFVRVLVNLWAATNSSSDLGREMLSRRMTTLSSYDGFRAELTAGGQGGAVSRHIYGHAGATLAYPYGPGAAASYGNQIVDYAQRFQRGRTPTESAAEIADDRTARRVADILDRQMQRRLDDERKKKQCIDLSDMRDDLKALLEGLLCDY